MRSRDRTVAALRHLGLRGAAIVYLGAFVVIPVAAVVTRGFGDGFASFREAIAIPHAWHAIWLTLITSGLAAILNAVMGVALAWVLVRFRFPGRNVLSSLVDLPLAIPTLVTGLMIATLYGPNGAIGRALDGIGLQVIFTPVGILLALCVVTLPARRPQRPAGPPGARPRGGGGGRHARRERMDHRSGASSSPRSARRWSAGRC